MKTQIKLFSTAFVAMTLLAGCGKKETSNDPKNGGKSTGGTPAKLAKVEKPTNAVIYSVCGWMLAGVKYLAWIGGLLIVLPLALVEILVGLREPDSADFV